MVSDRLFRLFVQVDKHKNIATRLRILSLKNDAACVNMQIAKSYRPVKANPKPDSR